MTADIERSRLFVLIELQQIKHVIDKGSRGRRKGKTKEKKIPTNVLDEIVFKFMPPSQFVFIPFSHVYFGLSSYYFLLSYLKWIKKFVMNIQCMNKNMHFMYCIIFPPHSHTSNSQFDKLHRIYFIKCRNFMHFRFLESKWKCCFSSF